MDNHPGMLAALFGLLVGALATALNHTLSFVAVLTAATTGASRYYAVLRKADREQVERATAYGFYLGCLLSVLVLVLDRITAS